jgi:LAO/AO transport system kinase
MKELPNLDQLFEQLVNGHIPTLSRAITLAESRKPEHEALTTELLQRCLPYGKETFRLGLTGVPGVGKSTFIDAFGEFLIRKGHRVAVLAIDPSSQRTGGSILGDKTRMARLSVNPSAYIRPSASGTTLGGVAARTRQVIRLCETAGYDFILVETVGVGQSETAVHQMTDFFLLLMLAGAGDDLQGIKRGIMEMADAVYINKAEGDNLQASRRAAADYRHALHLFPPSASGWIPEVGLCSGLSEIGLEEIYEMLQRYRRMATLQGWWEENRKRQAIQGFQESWRKMLEQWLHHQPGFEQALTKAEEEIRLGRLSSEQATRNLLEQLRSAFFGK